MRGVVACLLGDISYRESGSQCLASRSLMWLPLQPVCVLVWKVGILSTGPQNLYNSNSEMRSAPQQISYFIIWKSASSYFQSMMVLQNDFHRATAPLLPTSRKLEELLSLLERTSCLFSAKFLPGMCAFYFTVLLYLHNISMCLHSIIFIFARRKLNFRKFWVSPFVVKPINWAGKEDLTPQNCLHWVHKKRQRQADL